MNGRAGSETTLNPKILIIDDEERIRDGCRKVLTQEGFDVTTAERGDRGLKMIEESHFDVILLDLMMPGLSGFDVLAHAKALHPDSVIIIISGYATVEHSIEAMKRGAFDFIPKPFSPEQLRILVIKAIEYTKALQDIAGEKSRMRVLINHLTDGVMTADSEKRVVLANPAFQRMVGFKGQRAIGRLVGDVVHNEKIEALIDQALSMPKEELLELTEELTCEHEPEKGGCGQVFSARCIPFRDRVGRNVGAITVLHDITALKKIDQIRSDFVSMVAHEIRNPMTAVLAQIGVMLDGLAGETTPKQKEILTRASGRIESLVHLCSELLDLAKVESGLIARERERLNMAEILEDQVIFHGSAARAKNITLELDRPLDVCSVLANRRHMEEVLSNLITNAVNYTPEGGRIVVTAAVENGYVRVSVSDTGIGIPAEDLERIFAPFYRVKNEKTRFVIGTGLGLAIVKRIVEAHNGLIRVESEMDRGSTFHLRLPSASS